MILRWAPIQIQLVPCVYFLSTAITVSGVRVHTRVVAMTISCAGAIVGHAVCDRINVDSHHTQFPQLLPAILQMCTISMTCRCLRARGVTIAKTIAAAKSFRNCCGHVRVMVRRPLGALWESYRGNAFLYKRLLNAFISPMDCHWHVNGQPTGSLV